MVYIFICIDFDRDAAFPTKGNKYAVSNPIKVGLKNQTINKKNAIKIKGTIRSLPKLVEVLIEDNIPATFYFEGRTIDTYINRNPDAINHFLSNGFEFGCHSFEHEDIIGKESKKPLTYNEEYESLKKNKKIVEDIFKEKVIGFRAPYMRKSKNTDLILEKLGFRYDSSEYKETIAPIQPEILDNELWEFPIIKTPKKCQMKGMYTYLWSFFERKRSKKEIIRNYQNIIRNTENKYSYLSINLHSWHFAYNINKNKYLTDSEIDKNIESFREILVKVKQMDDIIFSNPKKWLGKNL